MKIKTGFALVAAACALGAPAFAKTSIQGGQNVCKAAFAAQTPAPASARVDSNETRVNNDVLVYSYKVKAAGSDKAVDATCTVDRNAGTATISMDAGVVTSAK
jgi:hypothetical protein